MPREALVHLRKLRPLIFPPRKVDKNFQRREAGVLTGRRGKMILGFGCQPPYPKPVASGIASVGNTLFVSVLPASTSTAMNSKKNLASRNV